MNCRECKHYKNKKCSLGNTVMRDGTLDAIEYDLFGMKLVNGEYEDCNDFTNKSELSLFDFIED